MKFSLNLIILIFIFGTLLGCSTNKDLELQQRLISEIIQHRTDDVTSINLIKVFGNRWRKICLQGPYQTREGFEQATGEKMVSYPEIQDNGNAFIVFYQNGDIRYVEIEDVSVMERASVGSQCASPQSPYLYFIKDSTDMKKYHL